MELILHFEKSYVDFEMNSFEESQKFSQQNLRVITTLPQIQNNSSISRTFVVQINLESQRWWEPFDIYCESEIFDGFIRYEQ